MTTTIRLPANSARLPTSIGGPQRGAARDPRRGLPRAASTGARSPTRPRRRPRTISSSTDRSSTAGTKPAPMPWILCGPGSPPESTGEDFGSTATTCSCGLRSLSLSPRPGDRAAGAHAGHQHVDLAVGVAPDLLGGGAPVDLGVGGVGELVGDEEVGAVAGHARCGLHRLVHAAHRLGDLHLGAVEPQERLALAAHALRQGERELVALGRADEGERDAGVAGGGLHDGRAAGLDAALAPRRPRSWPRRCGP